MRYSVRLSQLENAMGRIDETRPFLAVNIAVLTVSDTRTMDTDTSGATLAERRRQLAQDLRQHAARAGAHDQIAVPGCHACRASVVRSRQGADRAGRHCSRESAGRGPGGAGTRGPRPASRH